MLIKSQNKSILEISNLHIHAPSPPPTLLPLPTPLTVTVLILCVFFLLKLGVLIMDTMLEGLLKL